MALGASSDPRGFVARTRYARRVRLLAIALVVSLGACARSAPPSVASSATSKGAEASLLEADRDGDAWIVGSWTTAPAPAARYALVDDAGVLGVVEVTGEVTENECDHCPTHRFHVRAPSMRSPATHVVAVGPLAEPLPNARVIFATTEWWDAKSSDGSWVRELEVDLDGDGAADLARYARGPQVEYEVRRREGTAWRPIAHWTTPFVLDSEDVDPEPEPAATQ